MGISNGGLDVSPFVIQNCLNFLLQPVFQGANFGTQSKLGATKDAAIFFLYFLLEFIAKIAIFADSIQGWNHWRKNLVQLRLLGFPTGTERLRRQFGLRIKEIIKAAFFDLR